MRTKELRKNIRQASILAGAVVALGGFLVLLLTEQLQGLGDLITKAMLGLILGACVWLIAEPIIWQVCSMVKRQHCKKRQGD